MGNVKYILIVSQYYYSHHCFIVSGEEENFREKALTLIEKLEDYKRDKKDRPYHYGISRDEAYTNISYRWNVNDEGDIYFIPCNTITQALRIAEEYNPALQRKGYFKGVSRKRISEVQGQIFKHHCEPNIMRIVSECFRVL